MAKNSSDVIKSLEEDLRKKELEYKIQSRTEREFEVNEEVRRELYGDELNWFKRWFTFKKNYEKYSKEGNANIEDGMLNNIENNSIELGKADSLSGSKAIEKKIELRDRHIALLKETANILAEKEENEKEIYNYKIEAISNTKETLNDELNSAIQVLSEATKILGTKEKEKEKLQEIRKIQKKINKALSGSDKELSLKEFKNRIGSIKESVKKSFKNQDITKNDNFCECCVNNVLAELKRYTSNGEDVTKEKTILNNLFKDDNDAIDNIYNDFKENAEELQEQEEEIKKFNEEIKKYDEDINKKQEQIKKCEQLEEKVYTERAKTLKKRKKQFEKLGKYTDKFLGENKDNGTIVPEQKKSLSEVSAYCKSESEKVEESAKELELVADIQKKQTEIESKKITPENRKENLVNSCKKVIEDNGGNVKKEITKEKTIFDIIWEFFQGVFERKREEFDKSFGIQSQQQPQQQQPQPQPQQQNIGQQALQAEEEKKEEEQEEEQQQQEKPKKEEQKQEEPKKEKLSDQAEQLRNKKKQLEENIESVLRIFILEQNKKSGIKEEEIKRILEAGREFTENLASHIVEKKV